MHGDGETVKGGGSAQRIEMAITRHVVDTRAGVLARDAERDAVAIVPPTVRETDDAGTHRIGHLDGDGDRPSFRSELYNVTGCKATCRRVDRVHE